MEMEVDEDNNNCVDLHDELLRNLGYKGKYR